jgi:phage gpG-like protein
MQSGGVRLDSLVDIGYEFKPTIAVSAKSFNTLEEDIRSFRVPLKRSIQRVIAPSISANFLANGRPDGWAPYADGTIAVKASDPRNKFTENEMLRRSGLLWKTMRQYNVWTVTEKQAAILALPDKIWYGAIHQAGYGGGAAAMTSGEARAAGRISGRFATPEELSGMGAGVMTNLAAREAGLMAGKFATPEELRAMGGGGSGKAVNIPARPFAMFQTEDMDAIQNIFAQWLQERIDARLAGLSAKTVRLWLLLQVPKL